ncbi:formylglycine-generating enzyme family protein [Sorangium sp. So ce513]|uniref:formylglycine-generating enzyme family protein n=1 Tax=Sorangium sp. So ce513 TaxID=3133315 RepID=UPI003F634313
MQPFASTRRRPPKVLLAAAAVVLVPAAAAAADPPPAVAVDLGSVKIELVLVKAGRFRQGSPPQEAGRGDDEALRDVTLSRDVYMGKYPVTVGQFARFVEETGYRTEAEVGASGGFGFDGKGLSQRKEFTWRTPGFPQTDQHPVTLVTFKDAGEFTRWLTQRTGRAFDLPTEAQWEHAYRAGTQTRFYAGDADSAAALLGWFKGNAGSGTRPVGQKQPNAFGLHDMGGNVYEWCRDFYGPYAPGPAVDPEQTSAPAGDKPRRVLRGGSWLKDAKHLRAAARYRNDPGSRNADNGFRVVAALEASAPSAAAPAPGAPGPTGATRPATSSFWSTVSAGTIAALVGGGLFVGSVVVGLVGALASRGARRKVGGARRKLVAGAPPGVTFRPQGDGFWLKAPPHLYGATLHYRCFVNGVMRRGSVPIERSRRGQFVYTGGAPSSVEMEQLGSAAWAAAPGAGRGAAAPVAASRGRRSGRGGGGGGGHRARNRISSAPDVDVVAPFRGYPSAY